MIFEKQRIATAEARKSARPRLDSTGHCTLCGCRALQPGEFLHDHTEYCPTCGRVREMMPPKEKP